MTARELTTYTSVLALALAGVSLAQSPPPAEPVTDDAASGAQEEVVVTAQRRSERLVNVPISVSTATPDDIEVAGGASIENLTKLTPGVFLQRATYGLSPTVRGIGSTLVTSGGEQNVSLYVDNIYYPVPTGNIFDLASVSGVEILKGPQGTLFGRNATGGAILVHTLDPGFTTEGRFNVSYERFGQIRTSAYLNLPVTDSIAVNGSVAYRHSDGYIRDLRTDAIVNEGENFTARGKILWDVTDSFSLLFTAAHAELDDPTGTMSQSLQPAPILLLPAFGPIATDRFHTSKFQPESTKTSTNEFNLRATLETDFGTFTSYTAYMRNALATTNDLSATYFPSQVTSSVVTKTFTQEINFASLPDRPFTYVAGIYYFNNKATAPGTTTNGTPISSSAGEVDSWAGYVDGTYTFGDWSLIAGIRYSYEDRSVASSPGRVQPTPYTRFQDAKERQWTPRIGLRYAVDEDSNIYATYSQGFKSGIFDAQTATGPGVGPERVDAYEIGYKTASSDFTFNAAAYYYDYTDTQVTAVISGQNGVVFSALFNVPKSEIYGVEADATIRFDDNFDLRVAGAYTHARYIDFPNAPGWMQLPGRPTFTNVVVDASGSHMVRSPEWTASATLRYYTQLGADSGLELTVSPFYSSRVYHTFDNVLSQKPYWTLDSAATLTFQDKFRVSIYGRNLTDAVYARRMTQNSLTLNAVVYAEPRSYGVSFGYSF